MIMATNRHDSGDHRGQGRHETLMWILAATGGFSGYSIAAAKDWTANSTIGIMVGFCAATIGVCAGFLVYGLCLFFLRR